MKGLLLPVKNANELLNGTAKKPRDSMFKPMATDKHLFRVVNNICRAFAYLNDQRKIRLFEQMLKSLQKARFSFTPF